MRVLLVLAAALTAACASSGAVPHPFPTPTRPGVPGTPGTSGTPGTRTPGTPGTAGTPGTSAIGYSITATALALRGAPYRNGGSDPTGFDCSGFVRYVFTQHGVNVPRTVSEQFRAGREISGDLVEAGDLVFFSTVSAGASHVGIAIGGDEFVHAPSGPGTVRVERLTASYWSARFVGARRVL